jgi:hypothetical protein
MMKQPQIESITGSYEEVFREYEIYISPNRDPYGGGYEWSVCKNENEFEAGLEFSVDAALNSARLAVNKVLAAG